MVPSKHGNKPHIINISNFCYIYIIINLELINPQEAEIFILSFFLWRKPLEQLPRYFSANKQYFQGNADLLAGYCVHFVTKVQPMHAASILLRKYSRRACSVTFVS